MDPWLACYQWYSGTSGRDDPQICSTRDLFQARLDTMYRELVARSIGESEAALLTAVTGEIGNNCYDHNLGQWRDIHGCWFQHGSEGKTRWVVIADRGQGVFSSLKRVLPELQSDQEALEVAFRRQISGRSPERRGNGLKFVRSVINGNSPRGLLFRSGEGLIHFGKLGEAARSKTGFPGAGIGTFSLVLWGAA
ncbi:MAG: hypothetical protein HY542_04355 [Deltaproteobacteria bacterium]|nr:hypothetical protein [Deltaproteobacteria bacterium]